MLAMAGFLDKYFQSSTDNTENPYTCILYNYRMDFF